MPLKILIAGEGGQGVQTVAKVITKAGFKAEKKISYLPSFGVEQRGGVSLTYLQIGNNPIAYPRFESAEIVAIFCARAVPAAEKYICNESIVIYDPSVITTKELESIKNKVKKYIALPANKIAREKFDVKSLNLLFLGSIATFIKEIPLSLIEEISKSELGEKVAAEKITAVLNEGRIFTESFDQSKIPFEGSPDKEIQKDFIANQITWKRFPEYCKGCALCIIKCPYHAITFSSENGFLGNPLPIVDMNKCKGCGECMRICPDEAIEVRKELQQQVE